MTFLFWWADVDNEFENAEPPRLFKVQVLTSKVLKIPRQKTVVFRTKTEYRRAYSPISSPPARRVSLFQISKDWFAEPKSKSRRWRGREGQVEALDLDPVTWIESASVARASWLGYLVAGCSSRYSLLASALAEPSVLLCAGYVPLTQHLPLLLYYVSKYICFIHYMHSVIHRVYKDERRPAFVYNRVKRMIEGSRLVKTHF